MSRAAPFLRWVGGKQQIAANLTMFAPPDMQQRTYREPFLGAASFFFATQPRRAILSDLNESLIKCYANVLRDWSRVSVHLKRHANRHSEEHYYRTRTVYNNSPDSAAQAARFIYLNKACFNGIYRVNRAGKFNVPYGWKRSLALPDACALKTASNALKHATLICAPYDLALSDVKSGDFIYLDPPYPPLNGTAYFTHYTKERFTSDDQSKLAHLVRSLDRRGCLVMISNADLPSIRALYKGFQMKSLSARRYVTCKAKRHLVRELIIMNY